MDRSLLLIDRHVLSRMIDGLNDIDRRCLVLLADTEPPSIECPDDILVPTEAGEPYATVDFSLPSTQDNSGFHEITLTVAPAVEPPLPFFVGETNITYTATDSQGNKNSCTFSVTVLGMWMCALCLCCR